MPETKVSISNDDAGATLVNFSGELDLGSATSVRAAVQDCMEAEACTQIRVDMAGVTFCDSTGLAMLASMKTTCDQNGIDFVIDRPHRRVRRILELSGLDAVFRIES